jgi:cell division septation protein DedD
MRRLTYLLGIGLLALQVAGSPAWAAAAPTTSTTRHRATMHRSAPGTTRHWDAVAGVFRTQRSAHALVGRLEAKGFKGYTIRPRTISHRHRFEVERQMPDKTAAAAEAQRLRAAGFRGRAVLE